MLGGFFVGFGVVVFWFYFFLRWVFVYPTGAGGLVRVVFFFCTPQSFMDEHTY